MAMSVQHKYGVTYANRMGCPITNRLSVLLKAASNNAQSESAVNAEILRIERRKQGKEIR